MTKVSLFLIPCLAILATSCQKDAPDPQPDGDPQAASPASASAQPVRLPRKAGAKRIEEIIQSGRTGLWSTPSSLCGDTKRASAVLTWNIGENDDVGQVALYVVDDRTGREKPFGRGGAVGERQTGKWAKGGMAFKLRNSSTNTELASTRIGTDCPPGN